MRTSALRRLSLPAALALASLAAAVPAGATQYFTLGAVLKQFFSTSKAVAPKKVELSDAAVAEIGKKLGAPVKKSWSIYVGTDETGKRTGYAIKDDEIGLHEPIDFAVRFRENGAVDRVEILEYREAYGEAVRTERFRSQFQNKTAADPITAGRDIDIISGATYSSKSMALGVKRDTLVLDAALKSGL